MTKKIIHARKLNYDDFSKFGDVIDTDGHDYFEINNGMCKRFNRISEINVDDKIGQPSISIFRSKHYHLPMHLTMLERHPFGSQAFMPLHSDPFLIIVAEDINGKPAVPEVFITNGKQGINISRNTWHGVLTPIIRECDFLVIDLSDFQPNLEKSFLKETFVIKASL